MLSELFWTFAKIGAFTFGGGYAMISIIEDECVEKRKWITSEQLSTMTALAESTPGPVAINCATYTGYMQAGVPGAVAATLGMVCPSFLIIYLISLFFDNFLEIAVVAKAFKGIKIAVGILIFKAALNMWKKRKKKDIFTYVVTGGAAIILCLGAVFEVNISTMVLIATAGAAGILIHKIKRVSSKGGAVS